MNPQNPAIFRFIAFAGVVLAILLAIGHLAENAIFVDTYGARLASVEPWSWLVEQFTSP